MIDQKQRFISYLVSPKTEKIEARIPGELLDELKDEYYGSDFGSFSTFLIWKICQAPGVFSQE